jgi:hypothetical protein
MKYAVHPDDSEKSVGLSNADYGRQPEPADDALQLAAKDSTQPDLSEEPLRNSRSEKALTASVPGTEYWLP